MAARGLPCLNLALHSHELVAGQSAACPAPEDVDRVFANLERFFRVSVDHLRAVPRTLAEFAECWLSAASESGPEKRIAGVSAPAARVSAAPPASPT
jgi:hypothetical protein